MPDELSDEIKNRMRRIANNFKRQELTEKYGAVFFPDENPNLSPEEENAWLDNIDAFEAQYEHAARITVREFIGNPYVRAPANVPLEELEGEVTRLLDILTEHNIIIDFIHEVKMAEVHRFLVEELLEEEIDDIRIPDMLHHFIYEEFHPNDREDAKTWTEEFLEAFARWDQEMLEATLGDQGLRDGQGHRLTPEDLVQAMMAFHARYGILRGFNVTTLVSELKDDHAVVEAILTWHRISYGEEEPFRAELTVRLERNPFGGWDVVQADLPPGTEV